MFEFPSSLVHYLYLYTIRTYILSFLSTHAIVFSKVLPPFSFPFLVPRLLIHHILLFHILLSTSYIPLFRTKFPLLTKGLVAGLELEVGLELELDLCLGPGMGLVARLELRAWPERRLELGCVRQHLSRCAMLRMEHIHTLNKHSRKTHEYWKGWKYMNW